MMFLGYDIEGIVFTPVFKLKNGQYIERGPSVIKFLRPPTDKWWRAWWPERLVVPENWESWGYKCRYCDYYIPLITPEYAKQFDREEINRGIAKAFGEISGMNAARAMRIKIHSSAHNFMIIPALQAAFGGKVTEKMSATEKKQEITAMILDHTQKEMEKAKKEIADHVVGRLKENYSERPIKTFGYLETDDAYILEAKDIDAFLQITHIVKKSTVERIERKGALYKFYLRKPFNIRVSKSGKSFVIY